MLGEAPAQERVDRGELVKKDDTPENKLERKLRRLVTKGPLSQKGSRPTSHQGDQMKCRLRYAPPSGFCATFVASICKKREKGQRDKGPHDDSPIKNRCGAAQRVYGNREQQTESYDRGGAHSSAARAVYRIRASAIYLFLFDHRKAGHGKLAAAPAGLGLALSAVQAGS